MDVQQEILQQLSSSEWYRAETDKLLKKYHECQTLHGKAKLLPRLEEMAGKLQFQMRELRKYLPPNETL